MHRFYIVVDGDGFDASAFHRAYGVSGRDEVRTKKRMVRGAATRVGEYFSSERIDFQLEDSCEDLVKLIERLRPGLLNWPSPLRVRAVLVLGEQDGSVRGFFLSREFVSALREINGELDIVISTI